MSKPRFCFEYVFTYVLASFIITQQVPFLTGLGYDALERGILVAVCQVVAIALQILSLIHISTVQNMKQTIAALRKAGLECKVMVGGAVLNPEYAEFVGADYYVKDGQDDVHIAQQLF